MRLSDKNENDFEDDIIEFAEYFIAENMDSDYAVEISDLDIYNGYEYLMVSEPTYQVIDYDSFVEYIEDDDNFSYRQVFDDWMDSKPEQGLLDYLTAKQILFIMKFIRIHSDADADDLIEMSVREVWHQYFLIVFNHVVQGKVLDQEREVNDKDNEYKEAVGVIKEAWGKCRWNPEYKMCRTCQIKDLRRIHVEHNKILSE
jgi:hypothetical protein